MTTTTHALAWPMPALTPIEGKPTNPTIKQLRRELYSNARAIPSTRGGGQHGHLGELMDAAAYTALTGTPWTTPPHPGPAPNIPVGATQHQIAKANRTYAATITELSILGQVRADLRRMVLDAVEKIYLVELEDDNFGFAEVSALDMLEHLEDRYTTISRDDLEENRESLKTAWNPDRPIEELWLHMRNAQALAALGNKAINDRTAMELVIESFRKSGIMDAAVDKWEDKDDAVQTMANFKDHFAKENKRRLKKLTIQQAGYHGANAAQNNKTNETHSEDSNKKGKHQVTVNEGATMYYCWSHGLGINPNHTGKTCRARKEGHQEAATATNMMGGCNIIMESRRRNKS